MHLDLNLLRVFIAVAESGSFTAAAHQLHATQSTVSQRIARLEWQLDRRLLERTTRSTRLTEEGEIRAEFSSNILTGEVWLSVPEDFLDSGFAEVFARFKRLQPRVRMELRIGLAAEQREWIEAGEVDLAVIRSTDPATAKDALWSEPILWVASEELARELARNEHEAIPLVHVPAPCLYRDVAMQALSEQGSHWNVIMTCPHLEGIRAAVCAGLGVAAVVESAAPRDCVRIGPRHGLPELPDCNLVLEHRANIEANDAVAALEDVIADYRWRSREMPRV